MQYWILLFTFLSGKIKQACQSWLEWVPIKNAASSPLPEKTKDDSGSALFYLNLHFWLQSHTHDVISGHESRHASTRRGQEVIFNSGSYHRRAADCCPFQKKNIDSQFFVRFRTSFRTMLPQNVSGTSRIWTVRFWNGCWSFCFGFGICIQVTFHSSTPPKLSFIGAIAASPPQDWLFITKGTSDCKRKKRFFFWKGEVCVFF